MGATWPDFVVWDGANKLAIELKTPNKYVQGSQLRFFRSNSQLPYRKFVTVGNQTMTLGIAALWLLQYAADTDKEAHGRKQNMPDDYRNVFLIDLTVTGEQPAQVWKDLLQLAKQDRFKSGSYNNLYIYSAQWWNTYWGGNPLFFHGGKIVNHRGQETSSKLLTYDQIASVFKSATKCTKCSIHIPTKQRNKYGLCWFCTRKFTSRCVKCNMSIPDKENNKYSVCKWCVWSAQMLCNHLKSEPHEFQNKMCDLCFGTLVGPY